MTNQQWNRHPRRGLLARAVYSRDQATPDYRCPICGKPINWDLRWPDPHSRSLDHTVELQDGGSIDDQANCWTTHLRCNASKGARRRHQRDRDRRIAAVETIAVNPYTI